MTTPGPPPNRPPVIQWRPNGGLPTGPVSQQLNTGANCTPGGPQSSEFPDVSVTDDHDLPGQGRVVVRWSGFQSGSSSSVWDDPYWYGRAGPILYPGKGELNPGGQLTITVTAYDTAGLASQTLSATIEVLKCQPPRID